MAAQALKTSDISLPVLQKTTSSRVNATLTQQESLDTSDDPLPAPPPELLDFINYANGSNPDSEFPNDPDNEQPLPPPPLLQQQPPEPAQEQQGMIPNQELQNQQQADELPDKSLIISQQLQEDDAARRLQCKYASPENIIPPVQQITNINNSNNNINMNNNSNNSINININNNSNNNNNDSQDIMINTITDNTTHLTLADNVDSVIGHIKKSRGGTGSVSAFSDASSDVSDATTSAAPSATSSGSAPPTSTTTAVPVHQGATETDIQQADMFYRSQKTDVRVCQSLANMYLSAAKTLDRMPAGQGGTTNGDSPIKTPNATEMSMDDWDFIKTGIPVLVLNTGEHLRTRKLTMILAEKGTGFSLWEDELNVKTRYDTPHSNFHTLSLSTDSSRLVGFSFDEANAASEFSEALKSLLPTPDDGLGNDKKKKKKKEKKPPKLKYKAPRKIDISQPCCFVHVTKLERNVLGLPPSSVFPPPPSGAELSQAMLRSRSQSSELSEYSTSPSEP